jgi:hypothetical protein
LKERFKEVFDLCNEQKGSVAEVAGRRWRLTFRRWLDEPAQIQLRQLRDILTTCALGEEKDSPIWKWEKSKKILPKQCMHISVVLILIYITKESGKLKFP